MHRVSGGVAAAASRFVAVVLWACIAAAGSPVQAQPQQAQEACGSLQNAYGPFDYRTDYKSSIEVVDKHHFTPLVENLIKPMFQFFAADFDYTLRASPNHHRALISMARYSRKVKDPQPPGAGRTVDCYFERAMRFRPDDMVVRMIYADHLVQSARTAEAIRHLDYVTASATDNPFTHFNLGLLYLDAKEYGKALARAHEAQRLGFPRPELRQRLTALGKWVEPPAAAAPPADAAASAAGVSAAPASAPQS